MKPRARWQPYLMLAPTVVVLFTFFFYPLGLALKNSFFSWDLLTEPRFVGLENYSETVASGELWGVLGRTLGFSAIVVVASSVLGLGLALALDRPGRLYAFLRGSIFSAYVVSWVAVALLWLALFDAKGPFKALMHDSLGWLGHASSALYVLAFVTTWKVTGYAMVVFLAGLQDIPKSVLEAAALDGAGAVRRFIHVTLPLLRPTVVFVATTSLIFSFQTFDVVRVMTKGGPVRSTTTFVYAIWEHIFVNLRVGRASALEVVFFLLLVLLTTAQLRALGVTRKKAA